MLTAHRVREHCNIDDADDLLLSIYFDAGLQAAEEYCGRKLKPGQQSEVIESPKGTTFMLSTQPTGPVTAAITINGRTQRYPARASGRKVTLPVRLDVGVEQLELFYRVGPVDLAPDILVDAAPMIELGILKFVAYALEHRGDSPNSWAHDSGAASLWAAFRSPCFG